MIPPPPPPSSDRPMGLLSTMTSCSFTPCEFGGGGGAGGGGGGVCVCVGG